MSHPARTAGSWREKVEKNQTGNGSLNVTAAISHPHTKAADFSRLIHVANVANKRRKCPYPHALRPLLQTLRDALVRSSHHLEPTGRPQAQVGGTSWRLDARAWRAKLPSGPVGNNKTS